MQDFLIRLSQDYGLQRAYAQDPEKVMAEHKLSENEKASLRTGDEAAILAASGLGQDATVAKFIFVFDPEPAAPVKALLAAA